ncbi:hypothetical protein QN277_003500 [Acacia crassicarpa]|uniref:Peptidase A1 domain-containing protein n=1 Tax=Acacia crassicarpa TaxID=499986 RepID=A0AAE1JZF2_9FABA|nr:hypothetical protein QN277_003500 [Acacia crassicarpa]
MSSSSSLVFFFFLLISSSCFPSFSEILILPLSHSLSPTHFNSTHHLLKSSSSRSAARFHNHRRQQQLSLPLSAGSDYTLSFNLGTHPPQPVTLYMDTGSDLVWIPCAPFECILCEGKSNPSLFPKPLNVSRSRTVSCKSPACSAAHTSLSSSDLCAISRCPLISIETSDCSSFACPPFYFAYGDGSLIARLYHDSVSISSVFLRNFTFGCAHTTLGEPVGVAGFGRGLLSLPAQLAAFSPQLGHQFSYCLISHSFDKQRVRQPSPLILGRYDEDDKRTDGELVQFVYTPMLENPKHLYLYSVGLAGVSVGKKTIPAPEMLRRLDHRGNGGMVVDSGTTFTMLPASLYNSVVAEFDRRVGRVHERASEVEDETGLGPCYYMGKVKNETKVPTVTLRFEGKESDVVLPRKNYFYEFLYGGYGTGRKKKVGCLMLMNGGDDAELNDGPGATLGNYQQQGFEVVYDLEKQRVGFARRKCASLWDRLNQRN